MGVLPRGFQGVGKQRRQDIQRGLLYNVYCRQEHPVGLSHTGMEGPQQGSLHPCAGQHDNGRRMAVHRRDCSEVANGIVATVTIYNKV